MSAQTPRRLFNVNEYYKMADAGILHVEERVELINGVIYQKTGRKRPITVEEYHMMGEVGILKSNDRVELINGEILQMTPINKLHAGYVNRISNILKELFGRNTIVATQNPVKLNGNAEPQPDIAILKFKEDYYLSGHPTPKDILLIIEVAHSFIDFDKTDKMKLYAEAGIQEYWVLDIANEQIIVFREPLNEAYVFEEIVGKDERLFFQAFGVEIETNKLLG